MAQGFHPPRVFMRMRWLLVLLAALLCASTAQALDWWAADLPGHSTETVYSGTIVATNTGTASETVTIYQGGSATIVATLTVPPLDSATWQMPLADRIDFTQQTTRGAYRVETSDRVIVASFHPIDNSPKNDALAVLDQERLGRDYTISTFATGRAEATCRETCRNFVTIVGTASTSVTVAPTSATNAGGSVPAIPAGGTYTTTLARGEVLHIEATHDLTGTTVRATDPVAVFAGIACLGLNVGSCDQVSEQVLPEALLGTRHVVCSPARHWNNMDEIRVMAVTGATTVTVQPGGATYSLTGAGDFVDFNITDHVVVSSTSPVLVSQFYRMGTAGWQGDPSMLIQPATDLYLDSLSFISPRGDGLGRPAWQTFAYVQAPQGTTFSLDGGPAASLTEPIAGTGFACERLTTGFGTHHLKASAPMSVQVFGLASPTTYAYNGFGVFTTDFTWTEVCVGERTRFFDQSTQKNSLAGWAWDMGDGSTATGANPEHRYRSPGTYSVTMTTTDNWGRSRSVNHAVDVLFCNEPPQLYTYDVSEYACRALQFHVPAVDPDGQRLIYRFDWPDKPAGVKIQDGFVDWSTHATPGVYGPIHVNVTDPYGQGDEGSFVIERLVCPEEQGPSNADSDGDGIPDSHDACPSDAENGCNPQSASCSEGRVLWAQGVRDTTGLVEVTWNGTAECPGVYLVFNETSLLARVAEAPWVAQVEGETLYVQWSRAVAPLDRDKAMRVVLTCCVEPIQAGSQNATTRDDTVSGTKGSWAQAPEPQDTPWPLWPALIFLALVRRR